MSARTKARLVSLAALLPLLVVAVAGPGYDRLRCMFSGQVTDAGCCPAQDAPASPVVGAASCCAHEGARVVRLPAEVAPASCAVAVVVAAPASALPLPAPVEAAALALRATSQAPPPTPILLAKQSFLI